MRIGLAPEDVSAARRQLSTPLPPRRRVYGIGAGKTGTHALASLFTGLAVAHEPETEPLIRAVLDTVSGRIGWAGLADLIRERDGRLSLVVDVSNVNIFLVDLLVILAPDARFVLTLRDCYSWLDSLLNHSLSVTPTDVWREFADYRFRRDHPAHPPAESILESRGLAPLAGYLAYWNAHVSKALEAVPPGQLLVVRTHDIAVRSHEIAAFAGLDAATLNTGGLDEFRNRNKQRILQAIPRGHLQEQVDRHCGPLMARFFPDIRSPIDAGVV